MKKFFENILNTLKLSDNDAFDRDMEETESFSGTRDNYATTREAQPMSYGPKRVEGQRLRSSRYKEEEELESGYDSHRTSRQDRQPVVVRSASAQGMEVIIKKPTCFEDAMEVCDLLKEEHAIIINFENIDHELAQKMMDFISGAIYALNAKIHQISKFIFCVSPENVDISGDYFNMLSEASGFEIPDLSRK